MKRFTALLAAGASLLAMTAHAAADPVSIGFFLFAGPLGAVFSFGTLVTAAQIGLAALAIGASVASNLVGRRDQTIDPGQYKNTFESAETSEINAGGLVMLGGVKAFGNTAGTDRYRLILHCKGRLDGIVEYRIGGRTVITEDNGDVTSPPYAKPSGSWINIQSKPGDGTETAWTPLMAAFPSLWTADHKVRGIFQSLVKYVSPGIYTEDFGKLYQGGEPDLAVVARIGHCYDPRDETQDRDTPSTHKWTANGILWAARVMSTYPELTMASFDWDDIALEADKADATVDTLTGTEPRSRFSGVWLSEAKRGDTMIDILDSVGADVSLSDAGLIRIRLVDDEPAEEVTFGMRDILEWSWKSGPEAVERPNVCRVRYYSPERNYEMGEIDLSGIAWARIDDEVTRYGEKPLDIELPFCPSASQAQRIARRKFLMARADRAAAQTNWSGIAAWGLFHALFDLTDDLGETLLSRIEPPRIDDAAGQVEIPFIVWPQELIAEPWDPETMEAPAPEQVPEIVYDSGIDAPEVTTAYLVQYPDTSKEIRFPYTLPPGAELVEAIHRLYSGSVPGTWANMTEVDALGVTLAWIAGGTAGQQADFRVHVFDAEDNPSPWSDTVHVTLAYDNTPPAEPDVTTAGNFNNMEFSITVDEMHVAWVKLEHDYWDQTPGVYWGWSTVATANIRPGEAVVFNDDTWAEGFGFDDRIYWRITPYTSDGTPGTAWTVTVTPLPSS